MTRAIWRSAAGARLEEERRRMTLEALEDVDAGRVIGHEAIETWADNLGTEKQRPFPIG